MVVYLAASSAGVIALALETPAAIHEDAMHTALLASWAAKHGASCAIIFIEDHKLGIMGPTLPPTKQ